VGNPRTDALENDFSRLGFKLLPALRARGVLTETRLGRLDVLVDFRNAISHGQEHSIAMMVATKGIEPTLTSFRTYRRSISALVSTMDHVVARELASGLHIASPW
jgi:hypothetical protein